MSRELEDLKIEADHVAATGSDDFDVPAVAKKVRRAAGLSTAAPAELRAAAEQALDDAGVTGDARVERLAAVDRALESLA